MINVRAAAETRKSKVLVRPKQYVLRLTYLERWYYRVTQAISIGYVAEQGDRQVHTEDD